MFRIPSILPILGSLPSRALSLARTHQLHKAVLDQYDANKNAEKPPVTPPANQGPSTQAMPHPQRGGMFLLYHQGLLPSFMSELRRPFFTMPDRHNVISGEEASQPTIGYGSTTKAILASKVKQPWYRLSSYKPKSSNKKSRLSSSASLSDDHEGTFAPISTSENGNPIEVVDFEKAGVDKPSHRLVTELPTDEPKKRSRETGDNADDNSGDITDENLSPEAKKAKLDGDRWRTNQTRMAHSADLV